MLGDVEMGDGERRTEETEMEPSSWPVFSVFFQNVTHIKTSETIPLWT